MLINVQFQSMVIRATLFLVFLTLKRIDFQIFILDKRYEDFGYLN